MSQFILSRRSLLRGAAGAAVALPPLEIMSRGRARADAIPGRFLMSYGGVSLGNDNHPDPSYLDKVVPKGTGAGYQLTRALKSIGEASYAGNVRGNVKGDVGIVSGLKIPWGVPAPSPAGRSGASFHFTTHRPQCAGETQPGATEAEALNNSAPKGSTAEHIVGDAVKGASSFASVALRVQAAIYYNSGVQGYYLSYRNGRAVESIISPRLAYNTLFGAAGKVNGKTFDVAAFIDRRQSILDSIAERSTRLLGRLGGDDRQRMDKYFTEIRSLEKSLETLKAKNGSMSCQPASAPQDPTVADGISPDQFRDPNHLGFTYEPTVAWSDEDYRAQIMVDFLHLAFACDLTRSASLQLTVHQAMLNAYHLTENKVKAELHTAGHGAGNMDDSADIIAWHVRQFSRLTAKLRDTLEVDGSRLLDHCGMVLLWEGGFGNTGNSDFSFGNHSSENMITIVAGGAGGLKSGQHIRFKNDRHPAQVVLTAMNAVGVNGPLGEISEPIPELFRAGA